MIKNQIRSWGIESCVGAEKCYCESLSQPRGCGLLHDQGRSFVPYKKNLGFSTVWRNVLEYPWTDFNQSEQESLRQARVQLYSP